MRRARHGYSPARLRLFLALLLLAIAVPSAVLIWQTQQQLRWEALHQYRTLAEEMATRIDLELQQLIASEEARSESDYQFLVVAGDPSTSKMVQRSPLAEIKAQGAIPGLIGHFEVDADGRFSTPLLPEAIGDKSELGLDDGELGQRTALRQQLLDVLSRNQLVAPARELPTADKLVDAAKGNRGADSTLALAKNDVGSNEAAQQAVEYQGQAAFDQLNSASVSPARQQGNLLGRVEELRLGRAYDNAGKKDQDKSTDDEWVQGLSNASSRGKRKEQSAMLQGAVVGDLADAKQTADRVRIFESEVDPFEFGLLASGHGVLFRKVWHDGKRTIQGVLIDQRAFVDGVIAQYFRGTALWQMSDLVVAWQQDVLQLIPGEAAGRSFSSARDVHGELLYQTRLSAPLDRLQLIWSVKRLPAGPGAQIVYWASAVLFVVLLGGFLALYRLGLKQILLARQQQDFVSAVSHELKTPLTSIRMYAEMLRAGWAGEDKKRGYYDYIFDESERLSRLIANVLQLARMERSDFVLDLKPLRVSALIDMLRSKISTQVERADFDIEYRIDTQCAELALDVDADAFSQIMINLVDNAIKFSRSAPQHRIEIGVRANAVVGARSRAIGTVDHLIVSIRDYGPGVPKAQMKKIFQLFYRAGDELTRESLGTGIGLALVRQLARAMHGEIDVVNREPGAEFQLRLPVSPDSA